jgi:erythromycin esterase-like protein
MSLSISFISKLSVAVCLFILATPLAQAPAGAGEAVSQSEGEFIQWVREEAVLLETLDCEAFDLNDLSFLDKALESKRIVYLGVSDHWIHEKYDYRLIMIRYLLTKGWRHIGMEMGYSDGKRIDKYLQTGDKSQLDRVALYGYEGDLRADRDDRPRSFLGMQNPQFRSSFIDEEHWFLHQLRKLDKGRSPGDSRIRWFGFDVTFFPGGGYADARHILRDHTSEPLVQVFLGRLERVPGETRADEAQRLYDLADDVEDNSTGIQDVLGNEDAGELVRTLRNMSDSFLFCEAASEGTRTMKWLIGLQKREEAMIKLMDELLGELPANEKIILLGHNLHLSKDSENILLGPVGTPAHRLWPSLGSHLEHKLPGEIYSFWMTYDHGRHGAVLLAEGSEEVPSDPARIEHPFARLDSAFILQINSGLKMQSFLETEHGFNQNGSTASCIMRDQTDAIFFIPEVTAPKKR